MPPMPPLPRRRRSAPAQWPVRPLLIAVTLGVVLFTGATQAGRFTRAARPLSQQFDNLAMLAGLGINQVSLSGHRFIPDSAVFDALRLDEWRSMARFSIADARARIEALPWIERASVARVLPDRLKVTVAERVPFARWKNGESHHLIDADGRVLAAVGPNAAHHLPLTVGPGAPKGARGVMAMVARYPGIAGTVTAYQRVGNRRWTVWLAARGSQPLAIHLPADQPGRALARLARLHAATRVLDRDLAVIDLRNSGSMTMRPSRTKQPVRTGGLGAGGPGAGGLGPSG